MKPTSKRITAILLAISVIFSLCAVNVFAAKEATASVPIVLTVTNDYKSISVTVPASLPIEIYNGKVITADNAKITNNSKDTAIKVTSVNIKKGDFNIGNYDNFGNDKNTIALKINGISSAGEGKLSINDKAFPVISSSKSLDLDYFAKISGNVGSMTNKEIAQVVFTISVAE